LRNVFVTGLLKESFQHQNNESDEMTPLQVNYCLEKFLSGFFIVQEFNLVAIGVRHDNERNGYEEHEMDHHVTLCHFQTL